MFPSSNPMNILSPNELNYRAYQNSKDGQGVFAMCSPHFYLRGQAGPSGTATFAASSASGATETVSLALPNNQSPPEWAEIVFINHADAAVTATVAQTVNDFVAGSGTLTATVSTGSTTVTSGEAAATYIRFPYTADGPLVVTFTASASMTNGGNVGAQLRWC